MYHLTMCYVKDVACSKRDVALQFTSAHCLTVWLTTCVTALVAATDTIYYLLRT